MSGGGWLSNIPVPKTKDSYELLMYIKIVKIIVAACFITLVSACLTKSIAFDESTWREELKRQSPAKLYEPHFNEGKFFNPWMPMDRGGFFELLKWRFTRKRDYTDEEKRYRPGIMKNLKDRIEAMPDVDFITWIGHGTFLMRLQGEYWLTDPIFSKRALLPKRVTPPAIDAEKLNELTGRVNVLISHNHYDHLDAASIRSLPIKSRIFVPMGLKKYVESFNQGVVRELDWWDEVDISHGTKLICLPAQHWSRRIGQSTNRTLWSSYLLITPNTVIYFGGDSGYFIGYREIGRRFPNIGYALLPTTAYHPRWFMHYAHMNIPEALAAFRDLGARYFIPTQWGTFHLGDEPPGYAALDLKNTIQKRNLDSSRFIIMDIGQIRLVR
jgi:L-ascorbate metabolism protein UlaG (beta-lactamase superfamily)